MRHKFKQFLREVSQEEGGEYYHTLSQCIRSGQVSPKQLEEHMQDKDFKEYHMNNFYDFTRI